MKNKHNNATVNDGVVCTDDSGQNIGKPHGKVKIRNIASKMWLLFQ